MTATTNARLNRLEKKLGDVAAPRGSTLEQLVQGSMGRPVGPPEKAIPAGGVSLDDLVANALPHPGKVD